MSTWEQKGKKIFTYQFLTNHVVNANSLIGSDKKQSASTKPEITRKVIRNVKSHPH